MNWLRKLFIRAAGNPAKPFKWETFEGWFDRQGIEYFSAREFTSYFERSRGGVFNSPPPQELWVNILPVLRLVEDVRYVLDVPITITSSYRSEAYNKAVGGGKNSQHLEFTALDISSPEVTPREIRKLLKVMRDIGDFKGGLGRYPTFTHVDTRGKNATW